MTASTVSSFGMRCEVYRAWLLADHLPRKQ
jgi:hypothetical protein